MSNFVEGQISPAVREIRGKYQRENCKSLGPGDNVLDPPALLFGAWRKHQTPVQQNVGFRFGLNDVN